MIKHWLIAFFICVTPLCAAVEKYDKTVVTDQLLAQNQAIKEKYIFLFRGKEFVGYPNVYSPVIFPGASKQKSFSIQEGESFLEIGCGTGVFSIIAALEGAKEVVAIDINPDAVANTLENAKRHGVESKVAVMQGDMFNSLDKTAKFDVIFFNIPFCHRVGTRVTTDLEKSLFDPEHELLCRYLAEGKQFLKEGGRLLLGYSTTHGDIELMRQWAQQYGWETFLLQKTGDEKIDFITVELYEFRLPTILSGAYKTKVKNEHK